MSAVFSAVKGGFKQGFLVGISNPKDIFSLYRSFRSLQELKLIWISVFLY